MDETGAGRVFTFWYRFLYQKVNQTCTTWYRFLYQIRRTEEGKGQSERATVDTTRPKDTPRRPSEREHGGKPQHAEIVFAGETPVFIGESHVFAGISPVFAVEILVFTGKT